MLAKVQYGTIVGMSLTSAQVQNDMEKIQSEVAAIAKKYGYTLQPKGGSYTASDITVRWTFESQTQSAQEAKNDEFDTIVGMLGHPELAGKLGEEMTAGGKKYTIRGINTRANKYPLQIADENGELRKAPISFFSKIARNNQ